MKIKMLQDYGRLVTGKGYDVDDGTARSLVNMSVAVIEATKAKSKKRRRKSK